MTPFEVAQRLMPATPLEWLVGQTQAIFRNIIESFLNSHDEGLDGGPLAVRNGPWRYWSMCNTAKLYVQAIADTGAKDLTKLLEAISNVPETNIDGAVFATANVISEWYSSFPKLVTSIPSSRKERYVNLPKVYQKNEYGSLTNGNAIQNFVEWSEKDLKEIFAWLFIHGSYGTLDPIAGSSDLDTFGIISGQVCTSADRLIDARETIIGVWPHLYRIDPLQHHGVMLVAEQDLAFYPQTFFPLVLIERGKIVLKQTTPLKIYCRNDHLARIETAYSTRQHFRWHSIGNVGSASLDNAFFFKHFTSTLQLAPALILQMDGTYKYKKDIFDSIYNILPEDKAAPLKNVSYIRESQPNLVDIRWNEDLDASRESIVSFHKTVRSINTPSSCLEVTGLDFVDRACDLVEWLVSYVDGVEFSPAEGFADSASITETCKPLRTNDYSQIIDFIRSDILPLHKNLSVGVFGSVSHPGISDIDLIVSVDGSIDGDLINSLPASLKALTVNASYIFEHGPSLLVRSSMRKNIPELYPIADDIRWMKDGNADSVQKVGWGSNNTENLTALAEMAVTYFIHPDLQAWKEGKIAERRTLLRGWGLRYSAAITSRLGLGDANIDRTIREVSEARKNIFLASPKIRQELLATIFLELLPAQLRLIDAIRSGMKDLVDQTPLDGLPDGTSVGVWANSTVFVTGWTPEGAIAAMRRYSATLGRAVAILPAEIGLLFAGYLRQPGFMRMYLATRFIDRFGDADIHISPSVSNRLYLLDKQMFDILRFGSNWGMVPQFTFDPSNFTWGGNNWRDSFITAAARGRALPEDYLADDIDLIRQIGNLRQAVDSCLWNEANNIALDLSREAPSSKDVWYFRGVSEIALEQFDLAEQSLKRAAALGADPFWTALQQAIVAGKKGQKALAAEKFHLASSLARSEYERESANANAMSFGIQLGSR